MTFVIVSGGIEVVTLNDVTDRWDLFQDRFADCAIDKSLPLVVPYDAATVRAWFSLDVCIKHLKESGVQLSFFSLLQMEGICRYLSPKDDSWRLFCKVDTPGDRKHAYRDLGRVVRSGPRQEYSTTPLRDCVHCNFGLYNDPVYELKGDDKLPILDLEWLNITTGILHSAWCEHGIGDNGEVPMTEINWRDCCEYAPSCYALLVSDTERSFGGSLEIDGSGTNDDPYRVRQSSYESRLQDASFILESGLDSVFDSTPATLGGWSMGDQSVSASLSLDLEAYTESQRSWLYDRACETVQFRWSWVRSVSRSTSQVFRYGRRRILMDMLDGEQCIALLHSAGIGDLFDVPSPAFAPSRYTRLSNNNDSVLDLFSRYNRNVVSRWTHDYRLPYRMRVRSTQVRGLIDDIINKLGTRALDVMVAILQTYSRAAMYNGYWSEDKVLHKFMQIAASKLSVLTGSQPLN